MVVGTKCNKLLSISVAAPHSQLRPQLIEVPLPPPPLRPAQLPAATLPEAPLRRSRRIAQRAPGPCQNALFHVGKEEQWNNYRMLSSVLLAKASKHTGE